jgi:hypothetical protein
MWLTGSGGELCGPLSTLFQAVAYHGPTVSLSAFPCFVYWKFPKRSTPCSSPLLWCTQSTLPPLLHVPFLFLVYYSVFFFFFAGWGQSLQGVCWFIPGVAVWIPHSAYLLTCWSASPKQVWTWCLVAREPSCFLSILWSGEALYSLVVDGIRVLLLLAGFFSAKCGSSVSAKFLIYGAHAVCFLPLVAILDSPHILILFVFWSPHENLSKTGIINLREHNHHYFYIN